VRPKANHGSEATVVALAQTEAAIFGESMGENPR